MTETRRIVAVVDDDDSIRRALGRLLRVSGFDPVSYASAEEFLDDTTRAPADCLVLDVHLGGMSGIALQRRLAARGGVPPIIIVTAHEDPVTSEQARQVGCAALLYKPVLGTLLLEAIRQAIDMGNTATGQR